MSTISDKIRLDNLGLAIGSTSRDVCPFCKAKHEKSLAVTRKSDGLIYSCHRVKCGRKGFIPSVGEARTIHEPKRFTPKPFKGELSNLNDCLIHKLQVKYEFTSEFLKSRNWKYTPDGHRLVVPVLEERGYEWGRQTKKLPFSWMCGPFTADTKPKSVLYPVNDVPKVHFPQGFWNNDGRVALVEDILSAEKLVMIGVPSIAILGTHIPEEVIVHLADVLKGLSVAFALDNDATSKAITMNSKFGFYFHDSTIIVNKQDPKDTTIKELWGKYGEKDSKCAISIAGVV